jgi:hypothetical protein
MDRLTGTKTISHQIPLYKKGSYRELTLLEDACLQSLLNISKYVLGVTRTVLQFGTSVSNLKLTAHFIAMAAMMAHCGK